MRPVAKRFVLSLFGMSLLASPAAAQSSFLEEAPTQKLAFVLGNSAYANHDAIPSADEDAKNVASTLKNLGFVVFEAANIKHAASFWDVKFQPFLNRIRENDLVVFYFSGHGLNYGGENLFVMTDYPKTLPEEDMTDFLIPLTALRDNVKYYKPGLSIFIFDACRSIASNIKPKNKAPIGVNKGMTPPTSKKLENVSIAFSSDAGSVSKGRTSPGEMSYYTEALLQYLGLEGTEYNYVKRETIIKLLELTGDQVPWFSESLSAEIYLKPTTEILEAERKAWLTRLDSSSYNQIWKFTLQYPTSRYVKAAKRWLQQNQDNRPTIVTKVSPQELDRSYEETQSGQKAVVPRLDGPFGFKKYADLLGSVSSSRRTDVTTNVGQVVAEYSSLVVTKNVTARAAADDGAEAIKTVAAGSAVSVKNVIADTSGNAWLEFDQKGESGYLPLSRAVVGEATVGFPLAEVKVSQGPTLESLVDEKPIRDAVAELRKAGRSISRVSIATARQSDERLALMLDGRVTNVFYVLKELGISGDKITSVLVADDTAQSKLGRTDPLKDLVRIRFFGT
jgi:hypothetical protein